jgi:hypothetical protein
VDWTYSEALHRRETILRLAESFCAHLRELVATARAVIATGASPTRFADADLSQSELDSILAEFAESS